MTAVESRRRARSLPPRCRHWPLLRRVKGSGAPRHTQLCECGAARARGGSFAAASTSSRRPGGVEGK
eukprot:1180769-Prorocentrum_minimum.AAC.1